MNINLFIQMTSMNEHEKDDKLQGQCAVIPIFVALPRHVNFEWHVVVQVREGDPVLRPDWLANDDLVDVIELVPIFIPVRKQKKTFQGGIGLGLRLWHSNPCQLQQSFSMFRWQGLPLPVQWIPS